jgi:hypothetical protein
MSLQVLAQDIAAKGRSGDSMLVHMTPDEVRSLHALARSEGTKLTINPETGLLEARSLRKALSKFEDSVKKVGRDFDDAIRPIAPAIVGAGLNYLLPGVGTAIGSTLGLSGAAGTAIAVGGATALATGSLSRGLTAGLGAYGGASLIDGVVGAGAGAAQQSAISALGPGASQEAINTAAAEATKNYLGMEGATAPLGLGSRLTQGFGAVANDPKAFIQGMGGLSKTLGAAYSVASPMMADQAVETTTKMPTQGSGYTPSPAYYRPYEYDPETKSLKSLGSVKAEGLAAGGMVAFANGGINNALTYDTQEKLRANMARSTPTEALFDFDTAGLGANWRNLVANDPAKAQQLQTQLGWGGKYQSDALMSVAGLGSLPAAAAPKTATGGISDLVYRPLSEVNEKARAQGLGKNPLNDRAQGLEKAVRDLGLQDVHNQYGAVVNTSNDPRYSASGGNKYDPKFNYMEGAALDPNLQKYWMNAVAEDSSDQERQASARQLIDRLAALQGGAKTPAALPFTPTSPPEITSTEANRPTTTITPSTYSVRGEQTAPQTSTAPPQITATAATRPVANITPATLTTQAAAPVPLTSTAPPAITMSAAPTMRSIPVGGGGSAGMAAVRPFDYQSERIEEMPEVRQMSAEEAMNGQSLDAYRRLMGAGAAQLTNNTQRGSATSPAQTAAPAGYVTNPFGQKIAAAAYRFMNGGADENPATLGVDPGRDPVTGEAYQWAWNSGLNQWHVAKPGTQPSSASSVRSLGGRIESIVGKVFKSSPFAQGGSVPGYAMGGLGDLGGYSDGGRLLRGPGDGVSDSIPATIGGKRPARLADGEFVVPARIVSELGNGSTEAGARKLYAMMDRVQRARGKTTGKKRVAANTRAEQYLPA